jgi:hypothetical protein
MGTIYKKGQSTYSQKPTGIPKGYDVTYDPGSKQWIVFNPGNNVGVPTAGNGSSNLTPVSSTPVPTDVIDKYNLPKTLSLSYNPGPTKGAPYAPTTGKELYEAIGQAKQNGEINQSQYNALIGQYFGSGFSDTAKNASKVFAAATLNLGSNNYSLKGYQTPTGALINSTLVTNYLSQQDAAANAAIQSYNLNLEQYNLAASTATVSQEQSAYSTVMNYLDKWGLGDLSNYVMQMITKQGDQLIKTDSILAAIRGQAPSNLGPAADKAMANAYNKAFPGLIQYNNSNIQAHMTEDQYQTYASTIRDVATQYGAPPLSQQQIGELLNHNVSATEYKQRVQDISTSIMNADQTTKNILNQQYGVTNQGLFNYMISGSLPAEQRQVAGAQIQDYAQRVGLQGLTGGDIQQLGEMARLSSTAGNQPLGYGVSQIQNALLTASRDTQLTGSLPGSNRPTVSTQQLIGSQLAGFAGTNQAAEQVQVGRAEQAAAAPFVKGGGYAETAKGVTGIGSART